MRKGRIWIGLVPGIILLFTISTVWAAYDMVRDARVYQYSLYKAKRSFGVSLQVKVIKDNRPEQEKLAKGDDHPYTYDALWADLVDEMLAKVLEKEFSQSGMVKSVDRKNDKADYVVLIELNSFHGRWATDPRTIKPVYDIYGNTEFSAHLVYRKTDATLFKKTYTGKTKIQASQFRNRYAVCAVEAGRAFKEAAIKLMEDVETALGGGKVSTY